MEGREHTGVLVIMNATKDPAKAAEWNDWYENVHMPEILATKVFSTASRFKAMPGAKTLGDSTNLALYETSRQDVAGAWDDLRTALGANPQPSTPRPESIVSMVSTHSLISAHGQAVGKKANGALVVLANLIDEAKWDEYTEWLTQHHIPEIIQTGAFYAATRYRANDPQEGQAHLLVIYETELRDPAEAMKKLEAARDTMTPNRGYTSVVAMAAYARTK